MALQRLMQAEGSCDPNTQSGRLQSAPSCRPREQPNTRVAGPVFYWEKQMWEKAPVEVKELAQESCVT